MFKNPKGQEVGWIEGNAYKTRRSVKSGQIYLFKHHFGKKYFRMAVGIQKTILDRLKELKIGFVDILVTGVEPLSYWTRTRVEDIYKEGELIKEDRSDNNTTKWGWQYIWSIHNKKILPYQKTLIK